MCCVLNCGLLSALQRSSAPGSHRIRLLVHQSQAGGVIGKSGQKIKELREVPTHFFIYIAQGILDGVSLRNALFFFLL